RERPAKGGGEASGGREAFTNGALGGLHLLGRAPGQKGMIGKDRLVLGCDDHLPDAFRSRYNPGVLLYDEKGALRGHLSASDQLTGLGLFDPDFKLRAALTHRNGWSGVFLKDRGGAIRVGMALDAGGPPPLVHGAHGHALFV